MEHFGNLLSSQQEVVRRMNEIKLKWQSTDLSEDDITMKRKLQEEFWRSLQIMNQFFEKKARIKWIKEGGSNSKKFMLL